MGATEMMWSDRHPFTVIWVSDSGKTCKVQEDSATRTDENGMADCQSYTFTPNPAGEIVILRKNRKGQWTSKGRKFVLGHRSEYHDFSF
jgi:hypothetical protein